MEDYIRKTISAYDDVAKFENSTAEMIDNEQIETLLSNKFRLD